MRLHIDQTAGARDGRMIGRPVLQPQAQEGAHRQRVGRAPRDAALGVEPFEIADQQQAEVPTRGEARPPHHRRVERSTLLLDKAIEPRRVRSEEHTSELQSPYDLVCRLLLEKKKKQTKYKYTITPNEIAHTKTRIDQLQ